MLLGAQQWGFRTLVPESTQRRALLLFDTPVWQREEPVRAFAADVLAHVDKKLYTVVVLTTAPYVSHATPNCIIMPTVRLFVGDIVYGGVLCALFQSLFEWWFCV